MVIINPKFAASTNNEIWNTINGHIDKLKQDIFKQAGVFVEIYSRTDIKLSKGKVNIFYYYKNYICIYFNLIFYNYIHLFKYSIKY